METNGNKGCNGDNYIKRVDHLRIASIIATGVYLFLTTVELFVLSGKVIPTFMTEGYLFVLGTYATSNTRLKAEYPEVKCSSGEFYVYVFWAYFGLVGVLAFFISSIEITFHLFEAMTGVTGIFCWSTYYNIRHGCKR